MRRSSVIVTGFSVAILATLALLPARAAGQAAPAPAASRASKLLTPAALTAKAPAMFNAKFDTSKGVFVLEVHRDWAPLGADRFYNMVSNGFFNGVRFFRVIPNFMAQFGINGNPAVTAAWEKLELKDEDPTKIMRQSNTRGFVSYGNTGRPNSRGTQVFINYKDNSYLDSGPAPFYPFGKITEGMEIVDMLNAEYGSGPQNQQQTITREGNKFLIAQFPKLDYVKTATVAK
jgi:peptidyl-prolyl cis-trans isomerase A (cyclophilin A)